MLLLLHDGWIQHHVLSSTSYVSTFSMVRNVSIVHYTLRERMVMEVLLHDCCIQHHVLGSILCALYMRLEIYL